MSVISCLKSIAAASIMTGSLVVLLELFGGGGDEAMVDAEAGGGAAVDGGVDEDEGGGECIARQMDSASSISAINMCLSPALVLAFNKLAVILHAHAHWILALQGTCINISSSSRLKRTIRKSLIFHSNLVRILQSAK